MSRRVRNILIGVFVVVLVIAAVWLLSRGSNDFRDKYQNTDLYFLFLLFKKLKLMIF